MLGWWLSLLPSWVVLSGCQASVVGEKSANAGNLRIKSQAVAWLARVSGHYKASGFEVPFTIDSQERTALIGTADTKYLMRYWLTDRGKS